MSDAEIDATLAELTAASGNEPGKTRHVAVGAGVLQSLPGWMASNTAGAQDIVICDPNTWTAAGDAVAEQLRAAGRDVEIRILRSSHEGEDLVCDADIIATLTAELAQAPGRNALAVGAGTVNDIVKMATSNVERPYVSVATAASMNGYTSAIAAVLADGVKRTLPTRQAEAVFADTTVLCQAPAYLNQAGFGDLLSKPYSHADWLLSHLVRGVAYAERPARLLDGAFETLLRRADAVGSAAPEGIATLARTILLSGFTMAIAGTSSPASGGEHLVSHYWDMEQHCKEEPLRALHGTQVGIATRISAWLFERLVALEAEDIDPEAARRRRPDETYLSKLSEVHPDLTPSVVDEVRAEISAKQRVGDALSEELASVRARWPEIRAALQAVLMPGDRVARALRAAGCADRPSDIGVSREHAVRTLQVCRHIRRRYVGLDLMDDLGLLRDAAGAAIDHVEA